MKFPEIFSEGLRFFSKVKEKFEVKENVMPVFRSIRPVPYASVGIIDNKLGRLEKLGIIEKTDKTLFYYSQFFKSFVAPTVYVKKKINKIRIIADYSTEFNDCLKEINYALPTVEEILANFRG